MIRSFADKMKAKQDAYDAEQKILAEQAEQDRIRKEEERWNKEWEAKKAEEARIVTEELHRKQQERLAEQERQDDITRQRIEEWEIKRQNQLIKEEYNKKIVAEEKERAMERYIARLSEIPKPKKKRNVHEGMPVNHASTWQLTWKSFSTHPKIINLPMSEKVRLFELAQSKEIDRINQHPVIGVSETEIINYVLSFSGDRSGATDSHAITTFNPDTYSLWNGFTVSFWVRPDEEMNQKSVILGTRASDPVARFHFGFSGVGTNIGVGVGSNDVTGINNPMEVGRWYNWVISYTGTQGAGGERKLRMWINTDARMANNNMTSWGNQDEATESYTHGIYFGGRNTEGTGYSNGFACALDEVAIYNRCIDSDGTFANEVYTAGTSYDHLTNGQSGLVGYWKFNEGNGTTITDHSGNGNHGTFGAISGNTTAFPIWEELTTYE